MSKLFKHYKLLTKGRLAVHYYTQKLKSLTYLETAAIFNRSKIKRRFRKTNNIFVDAKSYSNSVVSYRRLLQVLW